VVIVPAAGILYQLIDSRQCLVIDSRSHMLTIVKSMQGTNLYNMMSMMLK